MRKSSFIVSGFTVLGAIALAGCSSSNQQFSPSANPTELSAYAARTQYPSNKTATDNSKLTAEVNHSNGEIKVRNFGTDLISNFKLWVNQSYVLHVDRLDAGGSRVFELKDLYNAGGNSMDGTPPDGIRKVQIETENGDFWNVQGPLMD